MSEQYGSGTVPGFRDTERMLMVKELNLLGAGGGVTGVAI